jgi:hypothetical protein
LLDGHHLYLNPDAFPYFATVYMPLYPYTLFLLCKLSGLNSSGDIHAIYIAGRALSWGTMVLNLFVLNRFLINFNRKLPVRIFCIILFMMLQSNLIFNVRPDALQLLFFMLFLYFIMRYYFYYAHAGWLAGAIFFAVIAFFLRQDSAISVFTLLVTYCFYDRSKKAYTGLLMFIILFALSLYAAHLMFGPYFFTNTVIYNFQVLQDSKITYNIIAILYSMLRLLPLVVAVVYILYRNRSNYREKSPGLFMGMLAIIYIAINHLLMLRAGSWINYAYPAVLLLILSLCDFLNKDLLWLKKKKDSVYLFAWLYLSGLFLLNLLTPVYIRYSPEKEDLNKKNYYSLLNDKKEISQITKNNKLFLLNAKYVVVFAGQPLVYGYDYHIDRLIEVIVGFKVHSKMLFVSARDYDSQFNNGTIPFIVAENNDISTQQIEKYYKHYIFFSKAGGFSLYKYESAGTDSSERVL